jgi:hypothetical protein
MSLLHTLILNVVMPILVEWIDLKYLIDLDTAICCSTERTEFLSRLTSDGFVHFGQYSNNFDDRILSFKWIVLRRLKVKALSLKFADDKDYFDSTTVITGGILNHVTTLSLLKIKSSQISSANLKNIFNECCCLVALKIENCEIFNGTFLNSIYTTILDQIEQFTYRGNHIGLGSASRNLFNLTNLTITCEKEPDNYIRKKILFNLKSLIRNNEKLIYINLSHNLGVDGVSHISCIHENCKTLRTLFLFDHGTIFESTCLVRLIINCETIQNLNINDNLYYRRYESNNECILGDFRAVFSTCDVFQYFMNDIAKSVTKLTLIIPDMTIISIVSNIIWPNMTCVQLGRDDVVWDLSTHITQIVKFCINSHQS